MNCKCLKLDQRDALVIYIGIGLNCLDWRRTEEDRSGLLAACKERPNLQLISIDSVSTHVPCCAW